MSRRPWSGRLGGLPPRRRRLRRVDGRVGDGSGAVLARRADGVQQGVRLCCMRRMVTGRGARHKGVAVRRGGRCTPPSAAAAAASRRAASPRAPAEPARVVVEKVSRACLLWGRRPLPPQQPRAASQRAPAQESARVSLRRGLSPRRGLPPERSTAGAVCRPPERSVCLRRGLPPERYEPPERSCRCAVCGSWSSFPCRDVLLALVGMHCSRVSGYAIAAVRCISNHTRHAYCILHTHAITHCVLTSSPYCAVHTPGAYIMHTPAHATHTVSLPCK